MPGTSWFMPKGPGGPLPRDPPLLSSPPSVGMGGRASTPPRLLLTKAAPLTCRPTRRLWLPLKPSMLFEGTDGTRPTNFSLDWFPLPLTSGICPPASTGPSSCRARPPSARSSKGTLAPSVLVRCATFGKPRTEVTWFLRPAAVNGPKPAKPLWRAWARRQSVPTLLRCCGTLEHRFKCTITCLAGDWPPPPPQAGLAIASLSVQGQRHLSLHGLLAVRIAAPPFEQEGAFRWIAPLPVGHIGCGDTTWYCDGSLIDGRWKAIGCSGFGVAAVSSAGDLLAFGLGWPPSWCDTAAAAEAWAMFVVVNQCPFVPPIRTDCHALLSSALAGASSATHHDRPLARVGCRGGNQNVEWDSLTFG